MRAPVTRPSTTTDPTTPSLDWGARARDPSFSFEGAADDPGLSVRPALVIRHRDQFASKAARPRNIVLHSFPPRMTQEKKLFYPSQRGVQSNIPVAARKPDSTGRSASAGAVSAGGAAKERAQLSRGRWRRRLGFHSLGLAGRHRQGGNQRRPALEPSRRFALQAAQ